MKNSRVFFAGADRKLGNAYDLLDCLGDGTYGWVWKAMRREDGKIVALKIPKRQGDSNKDLEEGQALIDSQPHSNLIKIYWMGRVPPEREWFAIEMEYFPSTTLAKMIENLDTGLVTSFKQALDLFGQILSGVNHLHQLNICHGDLKPHNILVSGDQIKISDFGSSQISEEMYVRTRENGGTILYAAPELPANEWTLKSCHAYLRADQYSLGVLLYYLMTFRTPHATPSQAIRQSPYPKPREINSGICVELEQFILRCLEKDPDRRWESVAQMVHVFHEIQEKQLSFRKTRSPLAVDKAMEDWSTGVVRLFQEGKFREAAQVAENEFETSHEPLAFQWQMKAILRDGRPFDCLEAMSCHPDFFSDSSTIRDALKKTQMEALMHTGRFSRAQVLLEELLVRFPKNLELRLKYASILGIQASYDKAKEILLELNREFPDRPVILKRLILVHEQVRDQGKAIAFFKTYARLAPNDNWVKQKREEFMAIGLM
ncbi:MAG: protein kinase [Candidatus Ozemobacteraceae bacterium]